MTKNDDFTLKLLTNGEVLAIEKESWSAHPLFTTEEESVWIAPRRDGTGYYVALFNLSDEERTVTVSAKEQGLADSSEAMELWTGRKTTETGCISAKLAAHDAAVFRCFS